MLDHIVVPLDGSEFSGAALPYALALATSPGATIELVSSIEVPGILNDVGTAPGLADLLGLSREEREEYLRTTAAAVRSKTSADVRWTALEGDASRAVALHVEESGADLVVLSTHGRGGVERAWLGSVADRLVRRLEVPALLVRPSEAPAQAGAAPVVGRILVPLDGSELAEAVLEPAVRLAEQLGAELVLLRVLEAEVRLGSAYLPHVVVQQEEHERAVRERATEYLREVAERLRRRGVAVADPQLRSGRPAEVIPAVAGKTAQMTAMATHGRGGLRRLMLGSVSDKILRRSTQPLLLVRPAEPGEAE